jgi:hypothetical protein
LVVITSSTGTVQCSSRADVQTQCINIALDLPVV